jgi:hypothetical protein
MNEQEDQYIKQLLAQALAKLKAKAPVITLQYAITEGFAYVDDTNRLCATTPEMLDVDTETVFNDLEDVLNEINAMFGLIQ